MLSIGDIDEDSYCSHCYPTLNKDIADELENELEWNEIAQVLKSMKNNKTLGPDRIFHFFWKDMKI